ncbi:glycoside hydrolase family 16 protein [Microvirga arabica]|uniref:glycoside hydrolase family 16 protein n=1 Tax=Microvirga arabica TaxID=1128671 RepID=UPI001939AF26|nr:glycoside hydrolase family 16 protein [Microvirga arabica]MBM1175571.1 glycoside hydrolase family 16 protein [Microvirga arabica]
MAVLPIAALLMPVLLTASTHAFGGEQIDLSRFTRTFTEDFDHLDVSARGPGTRWIARVPWGGNFGRAAFVGPTSGFPFTTDNGILRIEARQDEDGKWRSGLLASVDPSGQGFSQQYGYFEMRAKLPPGDGVWPAFWLIGIDRSSHTAEIDVIEHHGHAQGRYTSTVHVWDRSDRKKSRSVYQRNPVPPGSLYDRFNTYGVSIDPTWIRFFFNREEVWRTQTPDQHRQPMYILLNLGLGGGFSTASTPNPSYMYVDYIHAYLPKE